MIAMAGVPSASLAPKSRPATSAMPSVSKNRGPTTLAFMRSPRIVPPAAPSARGASRPCDHERDGAPVSCHDRHARERRSLDAGQPLDALDHLPIELSPLRGRIAQQIDVERRGDELVRVDASSISRAAFKPLTNSPAAIRSISDSATCATTSGFFTSNTAPALVGIERRVLERRHQRRPRRLQRRRDAEHEPRENREREREAEHARVDRKVDG